MIHPSRRILVLRTTVAVTLLSASLVSAGATISHAQQAQAPIQIKVAAGWSDIVQAPAFVRMVEGFNKVQSAIHVTAIKAVGDSQVLPEVSAGNPPDVFVNFNAADVAPWGIAGYALNLDPYIQQAHYDTSQLIPAARALSTYNGHYYAIPMLVDTEMLLINTKLFQQAGITKPPTTIEELTADALKLTKKDSAGHITQLGLAPNTFGSDFAVTWFPVYVAMFGGHLASADGKTITANCTQCVAALQWEANFYKTVGPTEIDRFLSNANQTEYSHGNVFFQGKVAMIVDGEYYTNMVPAYAPKGFQWENVPLPYPAGHPELANSGVDYGNPTMIMKGTKNPQAAFKVLEYMTSVEPTVAMANVVRNVPQVYAALKSPNLAKDPIYRRFIQYGQGSKMTVFPVLPVSAAYQTELGRIEDLVIHGKMTAQAGLDKVTKDMQTQLDAQQNGL
jgi:multiple sugar transport system substrate-binding protein